MEYFKNKSVDNIAEVQDGTLFIEKWEPIKGFEGHYEVSNLGRVKALGRRFKYASFGFITTEDRILAQSKSKTGYMRVSLTKNKKIYYFSIHRLVAKAFIDNKFKKATVNHIDGDSQNNCESNLEWNTHSENLKHSFHVLKRNVVFPTFKDASHPAAQRVKCTTLDVEFDTVKDACLKLNVNRTSVFKVCKGVIIATKGLHFKRLSR